MYVELPVDPVWNPVLNVSVYGVKPDTYLGKAVTLDRHIHGG